MKSFASYIYAGENDQVYNDYTQYVEKSTLFKDINRSREDVILGIESSFDDAAASLVNSFGEIKSNVSKS